MTHTVRFETRVNKGLAKVWEFTIPLFVLGSAYCILYELLIIIIESPL